MKQFLLIFFVFSYLSCLSQTTTITGRVTDASNNPMAGANIVIKGKVIGTVTDAKGNFELNTTQAPPFTIAVSMVGFKMSHYHCQAKKQLGEITPPRFCPYCGMYLIAREEERK